MSVVNAEVPKMTIISAMLFLSHNLNNVHSPIYKRITVSKPGLSKAALAGAMVPVIYFPVALFYSAGFNVNQNFKKKYF
jgi:hypothetical protein